MTDKTIKFINKAKKIHGDKYDYSKVKYTSAREKVIIICKEHGEFEQSPNGHLSKKSGCRKCSTKINSDKQRKTTNKFIEEAIQIHGDKYDYLKVKYTSAREKVIIICKEHGEFEQSPNAHLSKESGCIKCAGNYLSTTEEFINKAKKIHGDKYDYLKVDYKNVCEKVIIICNKHGDFEQSPNAHLSNESGCIKCGHNMFIFNNEDFKNEAIKIHGDKYDYSKINYTKMNEKVIIICKEHCEFEQTPSNHITHKQGCQKCANNYLSTISEFVTKSKKIHGDKYDYLNVNYINNHTKVIIICKEHGEFEQTPSNHLSGYGCKDCGIETMKTKQSTELDDFIKNANIKHNNKYDYQKINYINARTKIIIICKEHCEFKQQPDSHLRGCGCPYCQNKTEFILYEYIQQFNYTIIRQFKKDWCKNNNTNKYLPFDFCIEEYKIIIELDGRQHFEQVSNWSSPEEQFDNDKYKEKCANDNGYFIIRLLQEDVFNDKYDWKTELFTLLFSLPQVPTRIFMCKQNEYDKHQL
jgi:very-short-patch-repair endonuclease